MNLLEVSRNMLMEENAGQSLKDDFSFDFGTPLTGEQVEQVLAKLTDLAVMIRSFGEANLGRPDYDTLTRFRSVLLLLASAALPVVVQDGS